MRMQTFCCRSGKFLLNLLLILVADVGAKPRKNAPAKIAIVGGGIGGSSAAYFLREKFGAEVQIDMFEKNKELCGRVASIRVGGVEYEAGAVINSPNSLHMKSFTEKFGFETLFRHPAKKLAVFDGTDYVIFPSSYWIVDFLRKLWTFGLSFFKMNWHVSSFMTKLESVYDRQARDECYDDLGELIHALGGDEFVQTTQAPAYETFSKSGVSRFTIENWVSPAIKAFYGQNASANGFICTIATVATQPGLWSIKGGNEQVCYKLVEHSSTNVFHEEVQRVGFDKEVKNGKFSILTKQHPNTPRSYDIVVVATPIGNDMSHIDLSEACFDTDRCPTTKSGLKYMRYVVNLVKGKLNSTLFQCNSWKECPTMIVVPDGKETFYWTLILVVPTTVDPTKDKFDPVYAAYTPLPLTDEQMNYLFESYDETEIIDWMAFPHYAPPDELNSFVLNEAGLYYTSPSEWAGSFMEMSIISGKNAALLAYKNWYSISGSRRSGAKTEKIEL